jgi:Flp pilus assembly pilin Flp
LYYRVDKLRVDEKTQIVMTLNGENMISVNEQQINNSARRDGKSERGASMVEYAILVALLAVVVIAGVRVLGQNVSSQIGTAAAQIGSN